MVRHDDFTLMVDRTLADVSRYALRRAPSRADAEDAVAETYAVAWRKRHQIPGEPETLPWLYGVARRTLANGRRSGNRWDRLRAKASGQRPTSYAPDPDGIVTRQPVLDALTKLHPKAFAIMKSSITILKVELISDLRKTWNSFLPAGKTVLQVSK